MSSPERAILLLHPTRGRILQALDAPASATGLARKLGLPRQKVNYHLRELERAGFVELVEERQRRNCVERIVRASARAYVVSPQVLGTLGDDSETVRDRFSSSHLVALAVRLIRDVATLRERARRVGQRLATLSLTTDVRLRSAADREAFAEELSRTVAELSAKYHDDRAPEGRTYRFVIGAHPAITKTEEEARAEETAHLRSKETPDDRND